MIYGGLLPFAWTIPVGPLDSATSVCHIWRRAMGGDRYDPRLRRHVLHEKGH
jgi:hypothetical protein